MTTTGRECLRCSREQWVEDTGWREGYCPSCMLAMYVEVKARLRKVYDSAKVYDETCGRHVCGLCLSTVGHTDACPFLGWEAEG